MKPSQILTLSEAGYTSAQIALIAMGLEAEAQENLIEKPLEEKPVEKPVEEKPTEKPMEQKPAEKPAQQTGNDLILAELQKLNQSIYKANIQNSRMPEQQTPEDIIAEIIRPTKKEV